MVSSLKKILMKKPQKFMSKVDTQKWNYIKPLDQNLINKNYNDFYKIIKNSGAEIFELQLEDENEDLCDCIFTHDPSLVLNEGAIILNMGKQLRKKETFAHKNFYDSINIPIIGRIINEGTVEGGDVVQVAGLVSGFFENLAAHRLLWGFGLVEHAGNGFEYPARSLPHPGRVAELAHQHQAVALWLVEQRGDAVPPLNTCGLTRGSTSRRSARGAVRLRRL